MPQQTQLLLDLAILPDPDHRDDAYRWLTLTLAPCLARGTTLTDDGKPLLRPWKWTINGVTVSIIKDGQGADVDAELEHSFPGPVGQNPNVGKLATELETRFDDVVANGPQRLELDLETPPEKPAWSHLLLEAARLPAPVGAALNLTLVFKVKRTALDGAESVLAAPSFDAGATFSPKGEWQPPAAGDKVRLHTRAYDVRGTDTVLTAYSVALTDMAGPALWLAPPDEGWTGKNWLAALPFEAAAAADVARHLIDAAGAVAGGRDKQPSTPVIGASDATWLRRGFLAALRLGAHTGVTSEDKPNQRNGAAARRTAEDVLRRAGRKEEELEQFLGLLRTYEKKYAQLSDETWTSWLSLLREVIPAEQAPEFVRDFEKLGKPGTEALPLVGEVASLGRLLGAVREPERLAALMAAQWREATLKPDARALTEIASTQLSPRLILDRLDEVWGKMVHATDLSGKGQFPELRQSFADAAKALAKRLLHDASGDFQARTLKEVERRIDEASGLLGPEDEAEFSTAAGKPGLGPPAATRTAHPLVLILGALRTPQEEWGADEDPSLSARLAGLGVLMRPADTASPQPWRALTLGILYLERPNGTPEPDLDPIQGLGLAPWRVTRQAGLEGWTVAYDNHPLTARSLANALQGTTQLDEPEPTDKRELIELRARVSQVKDRNLGEYAKLPALKFGETYEVAAFGVMNSGALPVELWGRSLGAGSPDQPLTFTLPPPEFTPAGAITLRYLRRTPVGAPRIQLPERVSDRPDPFAIPRERGVFPLADDLLANEPKVDPTKPDSEDVWNQTRPTRDAGPILLLAEAGEISTEREVKIWGRTANSEVTLNIRPPAADLQVWHRWVMRDEAATWPKERQAKVLGDYFARAPRPDASGDPPDPKDQKTIDLSIDDPAAASQVLVRVRELLTGPDGALKEYHESGWDKELKLGDPGGEGLLLVQRARKELRIVAGTEAGGVHLELDGDHPAVTLPKGRVFRLELGTLVRKELYLAGDNPEARFRFELDKQPDRHPGWRGAWVIAAKTAMTVEVMSENSPEPIDLWRAVKLLGQRGTELVAGVDPGRGEAFRHVKSVTVESQRWRWSGRRLPEHLPFGSVTNWEGDGLWALQDEPEGWTELRRWDGAGFGDRPDIDRQVRQGRLASPPWATKREDGTPARDKPGDPLARGAAVLPIDLAADPRAQYWRLRATATNRYAGLMTEKARADATVRCSWRRLLIKNRLTAQLPRPKVRFVLPLTQPLNPEDKLAGGTAPLIVMLDETWGGLAGPVERLGCELVEARYPDSAPQPSDAQPIPPRWPEYGFDPIESGDAALGKDGVKPPVLDDGKTIEFRTDGPDLTPFGLTFDVGVSVPLPVTSCFEIRVAATEGVAWPAAFAKLRFRKHVDPAGTVPVERPAEGREPRPEPTREEQEELEPPPPITPASEPTDPYWVQLLPDFSRWHVAPEGGGKVLVSVSALRLGPGKSGGLAILLGEKPVVALPRENDPESPRESRPKSNLARKLFLIVTRLIREADGRRTSELPLALGAWQGRAIRLSSSTLDPADERLHARLLEVEHHAASEFPPELETDAGLAGQPLWQALFDLEDTPDKHRARIVRVSPPIGTRKEEAAP